MITSGPVNANAGCAPEPLKTLAHLRRLVEASSLNLDRAERIKWAVFHGPEPQGQAEGKPSLTGLEDITDILEALINATGNTLAAIENKLGE